VVTPELVALLRDAQKNRKQEELAKLLGIGAPHLSRVSAGSGPTLGEKALLRLADLENLDAGAVLRAAGKSDFAELLDRLYPKRGRPSRAEEELVSRFRNYVRNLPIRKLQALGDLLDDTAPEKSPTSSKAPAE
jgi:transcriptional regulator with XRE-family HTH domain